VFLDNKLNLGAFSGCVGFDATTGKHPGLKVRPGRGGGNSNIVLQGGALGVSRFVVSAAERRWCIPETKGVKQVDLETSFIRKQKIRMRNKQRTKS